MARTNPNQDLDLPGNKPKRKATGFPGMAIEQGKSPRSEEEIADARKRNAKTSGTGKSAEKKKSTLGKRPF